MHFPLDNAAENLLFFSVRKAKKPKIRRKNLLRFSNGISPLARNDQTLLLAHTLFCAI